MLFLRVSCLVSSDLRVSCLFFFFVGLGFWVLPSGSYSCSLGFLIVASFDLFMELESVMLDFHA